MKHKIKAKAQQLAQNPKTKKALLSMKPEKSLWGFVGIVLFFIAPEIIAFIWGDPILPLTHKASCCSPPLRLSNIITNC